MTRQQLVDLFAANDCCRLTFKDGTQADFLKRTVVVGHDVHEQLGCVLAWQLGPDSWQQIQPESVVSAEPVALLREW